MHFCFKTLNLYFLLDFIMSFQMVLVKYYIASLVLFAVFAILVSLITYDNVQITKWDYSVFLVINNPHG